MLRVVLYFEDHLELYQYHPFRQLHLLLQGAEIIILNYKILHLLITNVIYLLSILVGLGVK